MWRHNWVTSLLRLWMKKQPQCVCLWESVFTLDGDLGIGGGPPGLRVWLDASFPLSEWERGRERERWRVKYRQIMEKVTRRANNVRDRSSKGSTEKLKANTTWEVRRHALQESKRKLALQELSCKKSEPPFPPFLSLFLPPSHASRLCLCLQEILTSEQW